MIRRLAALTLFAFLSGATFVPAAETRSITAPQVVGIPALPASIQAVPAAEGLAPTELRSLETPALSVPALPAAPGTGAGLEAPVAPQALEGAALDSPIQPLAPKAAELSPKDRPDPQADLRVAAAPSDARVSGGKVFDGAKFAAHESAAVYTEIEHSSERLAPHKRLVKSAAAPATEIKPVPGTEGLSGQALLTAAGQFARRGHKAHDYHDAMHFLFGSADHVIVNGVSGVVDAYSGAFVPGTSSNGGDYKEPGDKNGDGYEDKGGMNVEHTFPQSLFGRGLPMRSDVHHLLATFMHPNGERASLPFGEVKGKPEYSNNGGGKMGGGVFEPPDLAKGRVARAMLYFYARYQKEDFFEKKAAAFWSRQVDVLMKWNREHPPDADEAARNDRVASFQGNRNPFIDDYTLADRIGSDAFLGRTAPIAAAAPPRLIITGPPGSGKGTFAKKIAADYGVVHISVGELLRDYAKSDPAVAATMAAGQLVDSALVLRVVRERLAQQDVRARGFILDGFPRRPGEAAALERMLGTAAVDGVIVLDVAEDELLRRIQGRGRSDDKADVFKDRMKIYREQTVPSVERFKKASPVLSPQLGDGSVESNYAKVKALLLGLLTKVTGPKS